STTTSTGAWQTRPACITVRYRFSSASETTDESGGSCLCPDRPDVDERRHGSRRGRCEDLRGNLPDLPPEGRCWRTRPCTAPRCTSDCSRGQQAEELSGYRGA